MATMLSLTVFFKARVSKWGDRYHEIINMYPDPALAPVCGA